MRALVKVNLTLHVGAVRTDGYHPVSSVCVFADIGDEVSLGPPAVDFSLVVDGPMAGALAQLGPEDNLMMKAARLYADRAPIGPRELRLIKTVPAAAGVAGGTADAAAVLVLLDRASSHPIGDDALIALSRRLGADGPVCTAGLLAGGGVWLVTGDGDGVRRLPGPPPSWLVLSNPGVPVPTGAVFAAFDGAGPGGALDTPVPDDAAHLTMLTAARAGRNDLRDHAAHLAPQIAETEDRLAAAMGCDFARMSGSGATVFGLFADMTDALAAVKAERSAGSWAEAAPLAPV